MSGALIPLALLPGWLEPLARTTPHFWALDAFRQVLIHQGGWIDVLPQVGVLLAFTFAGFALAAPGLRFERTGS
jgi:ABC-2 type transport system permease protein